MKKKCCLLDEVEKVILRTALFNFHRLLSLWSFTVLLHGGCGGDVGVRFTALDDEVFGPSSFRPPARHGLRDRHRVPARLLAIPAPCVFDSYCRDVLRTFCLLSVAPLTHTTPSRCNITHPRQRDDRPAVVCPQLSIVNNLNRWLITIDGSVVIAILLL